VVNVSVLLWDDEDSTNGYRLCVVERDSTVERGLEDWVHTAQRFFVQYKLWDIVTGETPNPAGDLEPSVTSGKIDLGPNVEPRSDGSIHRLLKGEPDPNSPH
jgi:hypothetical protein